jgi:hypothetical protein
MSDIQKGWSDVQLALAYLQGGSRTNAAGLVKRDFLLGDDEIEARRALVRLLRDDLKRLDLRVRLALAAVLDPDDETAGTDRKLGDIGFRGKGAKQQHTRQIVAEVAQLLQKGLLLKEATPQVAADRGLSDSQVKKIIGPHRPYLKRIRQAQRLKKVPSNRAFK